MIVASNAVPRQIGIAVRPVFARGGPIDWIDDLTDWWELVSPDPEKIQKFVNETITKELAGFFSQKAKTVVVIYQLGKKGLAIVGRFLFDPDAPDQVGQIDFTGLLPFGASEHAVTVVNTQQERDWIQRVYGQTLQPGQIGVVLMTPHNYMDP